VRRENLGKPPASEKEAPGKQGYAPEPNSKGLGHLPGLVVKG